MESASLPVPSATAEAQLTAEDPRRIFRQAPPPGKQAEVLSKLSSSRFFVQAGDSVNELAAAMDAAPEILAVGVVEADNAPVGLVLRQELFDQLGKPYGRDFFRRKPVSELMRPARSFHEDLNIFGAAEALKDELRLGEDTWYVLVGAEGKFRGVLSTRNLLIYLSDTTARDIMLARRLQTAIVRENMSLVDPRLTIVCCSRMAKEVGGDFYLVKRLDDRRTLIALCDVSGKGIAASLLTAVLGGIFTTYTTDSSLQSFLTGLNRYLYETFQLDYFVTAALLEFDQESGMASFCDMGHSYVVVVQDGTLFRLGNRTVNPPLGVSAALVPPRSAGTVFIPGPSPCCSPVE